MASHWSSSDSSFSDYSFPCLLCERWFGSWRAFRRHLEKAPVHVPPYCQQCKRHFSTTDELEKHMYDEHLSDEPESESESESEEEGEIKDDYRCKICCLSFTNRNALNQHLKNSSQCPPKFKCAPCGRSFPDQQGLDRHLRNPMHNQSKSSCNQGNNAATKNNSITQHPQKSQRHRSPLKCDLCNRSFADRVALDQHIENSPNHQPTFECDVCQLSFPSREHLNRHVKYTPRHPMPYCKTCDRSFVNKQALDSHILNSLIHKTNGRWAGRAGPVPVSKVRNALVQPVVSISPVSKKTSSTTMKAVERFKEKIQTVFPPPLASVTNNITFTSTSQLEASPKKAKSTEPQLSNPAKLTVAPFLTQHEKTLKRKVDIGSSPAISSTPVEAEDPVIEANSSAIEERLAVRVKLPIPSSSQSFTPTRLDVAPPTSATGGGAKERPDEISPRIVRSVRLDTATLLKRQIQAINKNTGDARKAGITKVMTGEDFKGRQVDEKAERYIGESKCDKDEKLDGHQVESERDKYLQKRGRNSKRENEENAEPHIGHNHSEGTISGLMESLPGAGKFPFVQCRWQVGAGETARFQETSDAFLKRLDQHVTNDRKAQATNDLRTPSHEDDERRTENTNSCEMTSAMTQLEEMFSRLQVCDVAVK